MCTQPGLTSPSSHTKRPEHGCQSMGAEWYVWILGLWPGFKCWLCCVQLIPSLCLNFLICKVGIPATVAWQVLLSVVQVL